MNLAVHIFCVALGGAFGALARFWLSSLFDKKEFPYGTLLANILASFFLGLIPAGAFTETHLAIFAEIGFCAALSTFSSLIWQIYQYIAELKILRAASYAIITLLCGCAAYYAAALTAVVQAQQLIILTRRAPAVYSLKICSLSAFEPRLKLRSPSDT